MQIPLRILKGIAARRPCKLIYFEDGKIPYLERFYMGERNGFTYYLHRMLGPDPDRDLHNHPWLSAYSIVLHGGYIERRLEFGFQKRKIEYIPAHVINTIRAYYFYNAVNSRNRLTENTWHSIVEIQTPETWTLFWHSAWCRHWGFLTEQGYTPSKGKLDYSDQKEHWWEKTDCPKGKDVMYGSAS